MKKIIAIVLIAVLVFALSACGGNDKPTAEAVHPTQEVTASEVPDAVEDDSSGSKGANSLGGDNLLKWMTDKKYSYDFEMTSDVGGQTAKSAGHIIADGDDYVIKTTTEAEGVKVTSTVIVKNGETYVINDDAKTVIKMSVPIADLPGDQMTDYSNVVSSSSTSSGTEDFNGKSLPYEEYKIDTGSVKYFFDGGQVCGFVSEYDGYKTVMVISNATNKIPADAFDVPAGYTEISY